MTKSITKQKIKTQDPITITEKAAKKVMELSQEDNKKGFGLKLYIYPGGCSGFQYGMDFVQNPEETDMVIEQHGLKLFLDKESLGFLKGVKIDFVDSLQGSGFKIDNPNVSHSCGCGKSVC